MEKNEIRLVIADQENTKLPEDAIERDIKIESGPGIITIISGMRRVGKSTLLKSIMKRSKEKNFFLNFDDDRLIGFSVKDFQKLVEVFMEIYGSQDTFYFDEIQNIGGWETFARRLHDSGKKVYITGSNASMLSRELGTRLTGRYVQIEWLCCNPLK